MGVSQSAALGYIARQSGAATVQYISYHPVITYHPVAEPLSPVCDIIITTNGIVYQ